MVVSHSFDIAVAVSLVTSENPGSNPVIGHLIKKINSCLLKRNDLDKETLARQCDQIWRNFVTLAEFRDFDKILKVLGKFLKVYLVLGEMLI